MTVKIHFTEREGRHDVAVVELQLCNKMIDRTQGAKNWESLGIYDLSE
jgi:hypothetical protein